MEAKGMTREEVQEGFKQSYDRLTDLIDELEKDEKYSLMAVKMRNDVRALKMFRDYDNY